MENYDDEMPSVENGNWVNENGESVDINTKDGNGFWRGRVRPDRLKNNGKFIMEDGLEIDIVSLSFTVPKSVGGGPYNEQEVMVVLKANKYYSTCPECEQPILERGMILMLEQFHIYPALCCKNMVWIRNGGSNGFLNGLI